MQAQVDSPVLENTTQKAASTTAKSLLWEISGKDLQKPSYLYGTIHMIGKEDFFLPDSTESTFARSEKVVFEINMQEMSDLSVIFTLIGKIMMDGNTTLSDLLSEEDYKFVRKRFEEMGLPFMMFERMKPMIMASFASGDMAEGGGLQSGSVVSYEMEFMKMAEKQKKEMAGLETIDFQMSMFDSIPYKAQAEMLVQSLKAEDTGDDQFKEMVDLYRNQDIEGMQTMFEEDEGGIAQYEEVLLIRRNENWIPLMAEMMKTQSVFFAVGAGHLGGNKGVINLLEEAGYQLKPL